MSQFVGTDRIDQQRLNDDEIDFFDLIDDIWSHKVWVFAGLAFTLVLAGLYLFKATPVYQADAKVKSATEIDLIEFSRPQLANIYSLDIGGAFASVKSALLSTSYRKEFYGLKLDQIKAIPDLYDETLTLEQNFSGFSKQFSVKVSGDKNTESYVQLSLTLTDAKQVSMLLNDFIEYALFRRLRENYTTMLARIDGRIELLNYQVSIMREEYRGDKSRRILRLKEAEISAVAVGQENPLYRNMDLVGGQQPPLYMLGTKAIRAEIEALELRESNASTLTRGEDHFIAGLPKLLLEIESLQALEIDFSQINLAKIDEVAVVPVKPIKPRKLLIMALALVGGIFVGLFMALIVAAYSKYKIRISAKRKA